MLGDAKVAAQQRLRRGGAETNNYFRKECGYFGVQPRPAGCYFRGTGFFVDAAFSEGCVAPYTNPGIHLVPPLVHTTLGRVFGFDLPDLLSFGG
jgi:hypothetical protein